MPSNYPQVIDKGVEIFQIETRNPHFHEEKGVEHLNEMLELSLGTIYSSDICPNDLKASIIEQLRQVTGKKARRMDFRRGYHIMEPINTIDISELEKGLKDKAVTLLKHGGLR